MRTSVHIATSLVENIFPTASIQCTKLTYTLIVIISVIIIGNIYNYLTHLTINKTNSYIHIDFYLMTLHITFV